MVRESVGNAGTAAAALSVLESIWLNNNGLCLSLRMSQ